MLKLVKCVLLGILDLIAPAMVVLMSLAAFDYIKDCNWLGCVTCMVGSMIPVILIYTHQLRIDGMMEYTEEDE